MIQADQATAAFVTTVTAEGQVILPEAVRTGLGWDAGTQLMAEQTGDGLLLRPKGFLTFDGALCRLGTRLAGLPVSPR